MQQLHIQDLRSNVETNKHSICSAATGAAAIPKAKATVFATGEEWVLVGCSVSLIPTPVPLCKHSLQKYKCSVAQ